MKSSQHKAASEAHAASTLTSRGAAAIVIIVVVGALAYANSFTGMFAGLDAKESIRDNPHIRNLWPLTDAMSLPLLSDTKAADTGSKGGTVVRRPILSLSFALNLNLLGKNASGFHLVNLMIHIGAALLLFGIVRRTLARPPYDERYASEGIGLALAVALLWLVHPVQTESVTYIVQRAESLMGCFLLLTLYAAVRAFDDPQPRTRRRWYGASVAACALAISTKEVATVAPLIVLVYDAVFVSGSFSAALRRRRWFYVGLVATWLILAALIALTLTDVRSDFTEGRNLKYALTQPRVILHYVRVALWPHPLYVYVNTSLYNALPVVEILGALLVIGTLIAGACWGVYRLRWFGFLGAWFFLILAPSSSFVAVSDVIQEHRSYLPLAAIVVLLVVGTDALLRTLLGTPSLARARRAVAATLLATLVIGLASLTHARNRDYHSEFAMVHPADLDEAYTILARHYISGHGDLETALADAHATIQAAGADVRDLAYANYLLGASVERSDPARAAAYFTRATEIQDDFATAHNKLGEALFRQGKYVQAQSILENTTESWPRYTHAGYNLARTYLARADYAAAVDEAERVLGIEKTFAAAHNVLGIALRNQDDLAGAALNFEKALTLDPLMHLAYRNLAHVLERQGDLAAARATLERELELYPDDTITLHELARVAALAGDRAAAERHLQAVLQYAPANATALSKLAALREGRGDLEDASAYYTRAVAADPDHVGARNALGTLLARQGRFAEAEPHFEHVLGQAPDNLDALSNLGVLYASQGRLDEAAKHLRRVLRLEPKRPLAHFNLGLLSENRGDFDRARYHYEQELLVNPGSAAARENLARVRASAD